MNTNHPDSQAKTRPADGRRSFLAKLLGGGIAAGIIPATAAVALGDPQAAQKPAGKGKRGGRKGGGGKGPNPAELAAKLIREFDQDGDNALNAAELAKAIEALRKMRGGRGKRGAGGAGHGNGNRGKN